MLLLYAAAAIPALTINYLQQQIFILFFFNKVECKTRDKRAINFSMSVECSHSLVCLHILLHTYIYLVVIKHVTRMKQRRNT